MFDEAEVRRQVCEAGRRLWELGLVGAKEGNISARIGPETLVSTPTGVCKGRLQPADLVSLDLNGRDLDGGQPSSEIQIHLRAYLVRPDCNAVVHAHPLVATAFSVANRGIPNDVLPESGMVLGPVVTVPFQYPGTTDLADELGPYLAGHKTFLLSHHGAMTLGRDCEDACDRMETLERVAQIVASATALGQVCPLPPEAAGRLKSEALHGGLA